MQSTEQYVLRQAQANVNATIYQLAVVVDSLSTGGKLGNVQANTQNTAQLSAAKSMMELAKQHIDSSLERPTTP